jgi:hypothetical protein
MQAHGRIPKRTNGRACEEDPILEPTAFDRLEQMLATRTTRRTAALGAAGSVALVPGMRALAQVATPVDGTPEAIDKIDVLYVQTFASGEISDAGDGSFSLSLAGGTGQTVFFTDRPERMAGALATESFLDERAFDSADPPNAALVTEGSNGQTIAVVELLDPALDTSTMTVTYRAQPVSGDLSAAITSFQELAGDVPTGTLGPVSLFIDDLACASKGSYCTHNSQCCSGACCADMETCPSFSCV